MQSEKALRPGHFHALIADLNAELVRIEEEYRWLYNAAYGLSSGSDVGGGQPGTSRPTEAAATEVLTKGQRKSLASRCEAAVEELRVVKQRLTDIRKALTVTYKPEDVVHLVDFPGSTSKAELRRSEQAQARRAERGEGFGDG